MTGREIIKQICYEITERFRLKYYTSANKSNMTLKAKLIYECLSEQIRANKISNDVAITLAKALSIAIEEEISSEFTVGEVKFEHLLVVVPLFDTGNHNYMLNAPILNHYGTQQFMKHDGNFGNNLPAQGAIMRPAIKDEISGFIDKIPDAIFENKAYSFHHFVNVFEAVKESFSKNDKLADKPKSGAVTTI